MYVSVCVVLIKSFTLKKKLVVFKPPRKMKIAIFIEGKNTYNLENNIVKVTYDLTSPRTRFLSTFFFNVMN